VRVRRLGGCRAGEIRLSRFLHNARVRVSEMIASAFARTARAAGRPVLVLQDTTTLRDDGAGTSRSSRKFPLFPGAGRQTGPGTDRRSCCPPSPTRSESQTSPQHATPSTPNHHDVCMP
jgi:nicotinamidase-related amidase